MHPTSPDPRTHWTLEADLAFLNHGSFGACPREVLDAQAAHRARMEAQPVRFFVEELEPALEATRREVAVFLRAEPDDLVFVRNATEGVNAVLRSLRFAPGDAILITDHGYHAVENAARYVAAREGARVDVAKVPFPLTDPEQVTRAVLDALTPTTRLVIVDHVTSPTGLVFPVEAIARALDARGVDLLVDGAHAPGMLDLDLRALGAAYYTGNFHKWICAPKGAAFLHVRRDRQGPIVPPVISHGLDSTRPRARFLETFDWTGTHDPSAVLAIPAALAFVDRWFGGWPRLRESNRALALAARDRLAEVLGVAPPAPDSMIGSLVALPLPPGGGRPTSHLYTDPLQTELREAHRIEVPIVPWPAPPARLVRVSAMPYVTLEDIERLAHALR
ncbi:MAG: aminotransferase class V-fold PLP-dependent enzyme [Myxococcales bacterium]|nr:aminotransferase class V-fold PLP-dependent enzyme [Myxococcales bacterium]